jgi:hypothetical protein
MFSLVLLFSLSTQLAAALQLTYAQQFVGHTTWTTDLGIDFTVYSPIEVSEKRIRIVEASLISRSSHTNYKTIGGSVDDLRGQHVLDARLVAVKEPNVFKRARARLVLAPGVYCLTSSGFLRDKILTTGNDTSAIVAGDSGGGAVVITAALNGSSDLSASQPHYNAGHLHAGATLVFRVIDDAAPVEPLEAYADCEAVARACRPTGEYNVSGRMRHCDNE